MQQDFVGMMSQSCDFGMFGISKAEHYPLCGYIMRMFGMSGIS